MTFNQELITKARKGEIAILNDGDREDLQIVQNKIFPGKNVNTGMFKYYWVDRGSWNFTDDIPSAFPTHSVKEFFTKQTPK